MTDHLGSVIAVVDAGTGTITERRSYNAWGVVEEDTAPGTEPFGFGGGLEDGTTGLVRFGARDYEPGVGAWTGRDPIGFAGRSTNLRAYVNADPVNLADPSGTASAQAGLNEFAGFFDCLTFGWTKRIRDRYFGYNNIDPTSAAYFQGISSANDVQLSLAFGGFGKLAAVARGPLEVEEAVVDANKLNHIFGNASHGLGPLVEGLGSQDAAFKSVQSATQAAVESRGIAGVFETTVNVAGHNVLVRGNVIDGVARIGTFFIPAIP